MIKHKFRLRTKDVRYLTKKRQYWANWFFGFRRINQYKNRNFNQISCHIWVKLCKNATTRNRLRRVIISYIRDNDISITPINWQFYKIFINLNKNKIPELIKYIEQHNKHEQNMYISKEFQSVFISFQSFLCWKK